MIKLFIMKKVKQCNNHPPNVCFPQEKIDLNTIWDAKDAIHPWEIVFGVNITDN